MWIILFNATDDFGVKEIINHSAGSKRERIEEVQQQIMDEALQGALRIAGLVCKIRILRVQRLTSALGHIGCCINGTWIFSY